MSSHSDHHGESPATSVVDPVCGMHLDPASAQFQVTDQGQTYWFCSARCQSAFEADPGTSSSPAPAASATLSAILTLRPRRAVRLVPAPPID